jgi:hypothetical protein
MTKNSPIALVATALTPAGLSELVKEIRKAHANVQRATRSVLESARLAGDGLLELKEQVPHGQWTALVEKEFGFSLRTAQVYMQLARNWDTLDLAKAQSAALLSLRDAVAYLRPVREESAVAEDPHAVYQRDVEAALNQHEEQEVAVAAQAAPKQQAEPVQAVEGEVVVKSETVNRIIYQIAMGLGVLERHAQSITPKQMAYLAECHQRLGKLIEQS